MKAHVVILKTGSTFPALIAKRGDFEDWILAGMGLHRKAALIIDVAANHAYFPPFDAISGVVITGSHAMVTDRHDWSERTALWVRKVVEHQLPVFGICYGHQLLAYALGGQVGNNPDGREFGTTSIHLHETARQDPLLGSLPTAFNAHVSHTQSVLRLPAEAVPLASSAMDSHQAFVVNGCAWGVQFHPEFDVQIVQEYIKACSHLLEEQETNPQRLHRECQPTPESTALLAKFRRLLARSDRVAL